MTNPIPLSFARSLLELGEADIRYALERGLISATDVAHVRSGGDGFGPSSNAPSGDDLRSRWLFVALTWLYEHRNDLLDPLQEVEILYADLDYPPEIAHFVRYMPMVGPDLGSQAACEARLFDYWRDYLCRQRELYGAG